MRELGIYVHIPFCKQKCYYCDFISYANKEKFIEQYVKSLIKEISRESINFKDVIVTTIYLGGGTPSILNEKYIADILKTIKNNFEIDNNAEITIEINPGTVDKEKLEKYLKYGINRLSIGLQSTNNKLLKEIGRIHTYEQFLKVYEEAVNVGFENINVDLMLGLPKQSIKDIEESVNEIINLNSQHISVYSLIVEEDTKIEKMLQEGILKLPNEELERKMYWKVKKELENKGYKHYEISNFAKQGYESKHNSNCWEQKEYLGFGVAAHSYINGKRYCNTSNLQNYIDNIEIGDYIKNREICEIQNNKDMMNEFMLLGLRKLNGVNIQEFKNKFVDNPIYVYRKELEKLVKEDLIEVNLNSIKLTNRGIDFANIVWEEFI